MYFLPFRGSESHIHAQLNRTITAIKWLGGDVEALTTPSTAEIYHGDRNTPLMMAVRANLPTVVEELRESGASVHTENNLGTTVLYYLYTPTRTDPKFTFDIARMLVSAGANLDIETKTNIPPSHHHVMSRRVRVVPVARDRCHRNYSIGYERVCSPCARNSAIVG